MHQGRRLWPNYAPTRNGGYFIIGIGCFTAQLFLGNLVMLALAVFPMWVFFESLRQVSANEELWTIWLMMAAGLGIWGVLSILLMLAVGGGLFWWGLRRLRHAQQLDEGAVAAGVITGRWRRPRGGGGLTYQFAPWETGEELTITQYDWRAYPRYQVGDTIQVRYLADNPQVCRIELPTAELEV